MNKLASDKQIQVVGALVEGSSIRSTERMTGVHRDTITRLMVQVGLGCSALMNRRMRGLRCQHLQLDEIWAYVGKKQRQIRESDDQSRVGDFWTFVALDPDTKLVPSFRVGKRDASNTRAFVQDLAARVRGRVQISADQMPAYVEAIRMEFGNDADFAQIVKSYEAEAIGPGRYSPPRVVQVSSRRIFGNPDPTRVSTSHVERQNLTMRMQMRRFTRLTNGFSKKPENLWAAVALHFAWYNFVRVHRSLRVTPAMAAGVTGRVWELGELVELAENPT